MTELLQMSKLFSFFIVKGFLLRYITLSYLNWLKNDRSSNFKRKSEYD